MSFSIASRIKKRLEEFTHDLEAGETIQTKYTCRKVEFNLKPKAFNSKAVRQTRNLLCASQKIFALFLGTSVKTVQAWEQGQGAPPKMACRFMDEIRRDPGYWRKRLKDSVVVK